MTEVIKINFKITGGEKAAANLQLEVNNGMTISELKDLLCVPTAISTENMRLIFRGRILKDDDVIKEVGVLPEKTIYVVRSGGVQSVQPTPPPTVTPTPPPNPMLGDMMNSPELAGLMSNMGGGGAIPDMASIQQLMQNPMVQQMMQEMMRNPETLQNLMQSNPMMQNMMQNQDPQTINNLLTSTMQMFNNQPQTATTPEAPTQAPADLYKTQVERLCEMGFIDKEANLQALTETFGDINAAISKLLERGMGN